MRTAFFWCVLPALAWAGEAAGVSAEAAGAAAPAGEVAPPPEGEVAPPPEGQPQSAPERTARPRRGAAPQPDPGALLLVGVALAWGFGLWAARRALPGTAA